MISERDKHIAFIISEIILSSLCILGIFFGFFGDSLFDYSVHPGVVVLSLVVLSFTLIFMAYDICTIIKGKTIITSANTELYHKPSEYYLSPPREYLSDIEAHNFAYNNSTSKDNAKTGRIKCHFNAKYYDIQKAQTVNFQCNEDAMEKGFCIFHEDGFQTGREIEIGNRLNDRISELIEDGQEVFCIGYNIPFVSLAGKKIYKPIYFHDAKIRIADFRESFFTEGATAYFVNTKFEEASFDDVIFHGPVLFNSSIFNRESQRQGFFYKWEHNYNLAKKYSGYASFRNAEFYDQANFEKTRFYGIAFFDDAKFFENAIFDDSSFNVDSEKLTLFEASFYGNLSRYKLGMGDGKIPYD